LKYIWSKKRQNDDHGSYLFAAMTVGGGAFLLCLLFTRRGGWDRLDGASFVFVMVMGMLFGLRAKRNYEKKSKQNR
jgi:membrane-associated PAP2 superfamily phosphatase